MGEENEIDVVVDETGTDGSCAFDTFAFIFHSVGKRPRTFLSLSKRLSLVTSNQMFKLPLLRYHYSILKSVIHRDKELKMAVTI